jgi:transposase
MRNFAKGLRKDQSTVEAALYYEFSNGSVEGHNNRLKMIKRQMYGRANSDLLRLRVLYS